jgi:RNA polymerase sigma-70 factor (ECF subfamily)
MARKKCPQANSQIRLPWRFVPSRFVGWRSASTCEELSNLQNRAAAFAIPSDLVKKGTDIMNAVRRAPEQLIGLAHAGNTLALGELLELYRAYLELLARLQIGRRLQGKVDAADLVQETFLAAHAGFAEFRGASEVELVVWLRQILASRLAKLLRYYYGTQGRDIRLERELADSIDRSSEILDDGLIARQSSPSQQAARREQAVLLADALKHLPQSYREVLILRHLERLSFPEIARRLDRTVDSVEKFWTRGLGQLRQSLGGS